MQCKYMKKMKFTVVKISHLNTNKFHETIHEHENTQKACRRLFSDFDNKQVNVDVSNEIEAIDTMLQEKWNKSHRRMRGVDEHT